MPMRPEIEVKEVKPGTKEAFWREAIVAWAESGLAQVEFCRVRGLSLASFRRYRTRLTRPANGTDSDKGDLIPATEIAAPSFVEVEMPKVSLSSVGTAALEVVLSNGRRIAVSNGFDGTTLVELVKVLERC